MIPGGPADKGQTANARPMTAADAKAQREARAKMPTLEAAERRMTALSAAVRGLEGNALFDGGPVDRLALALTEDGQRIKALSSQLLPVLTALTRVPGIGSQSDLETRLNGLQFPSTEYPPAVNRELAAELDMFIKDLRAAAERVANGEDFQPAAPASAPAASGWGKAVEVPR